MKILIVKNRLNGVRTGALRGVRVQGKDRGSEGDTR